MGVVEEDEDEEMLLWRGAEPSRAEQSRAVRQMRSLSSGTAGARRREYYHRRAERKT